MGIDVHNRSQMVKEGNTLFFLYKNILMNT